MSQPAVRRAALLGAGLVTALGEGVPANLAGLKNRPRPLKRRPRKKG